MRLVIKLKNNKLRKCL